MDQSQLDDQVRKILDQVRRRLVAGASGSLQDFASMENAICDELNRAKANLLQAWCNEARDDTGSPPCPHCGGPMRNKGRRELPLIAEGGTVNVRRTRWWCDACKASFSPSGQPGDRGGLSGDATSGQDGGR